MKKTLITLAALLAATASYAQGTVNFTTKSGTAVDAPVLYAPSSGAPFTADGRFAGQLFWSNLDANNWTALGSATPFRTGAGQGYITAGGVQTITGKFGGDKVDIQLRGWATDQFTDPNGQKGYAANPGETGPLGGAGASVLKGLTLGGQGADPSVPPGTPALLAGLQGFTIPALVPEPSITALGLLGAGLLLIRRKK